MRRAFFALCFFLSAFIGATAQQGYWQQRVEYVMDIDFNVKTNQYSGKQKLTYYNNSPDTLYKVFYHLYLNAFQPGSAMDMRNQSIEDPDPRLSKISKLKPEEMGWQKIRSLKQNGKDVSYKVAETILEVTLEKPIKPGDKAVFEMEFDAQISIQIRRNGRDNAEGIQYSMSQWYPKMCAYDRKGWHANEYLGREFYGEWGDFEVKISIDSNYTLGATGYLQNPQEVGHGYEEGKPIKRGAGDKVTWHFKSPMVHDFVWSADKDYTVYSQQVPDGPKLWFVYQPDSATRPTWPKLGDYMVKAMKWMNEHYGVYPYKQYSFIQGGDGGMEYPMATLITGKRNMSSLVGVSVHEMNHSWFQGVLAFDESHYAWMDEGFTTYVSDEVMRFLYGGDGPLFKSGYDNYYTMTEDHQDEPLTTHADFYNTNRGYGISVYNKGGILLGQLRYIVGDKAYSEGMLRFFNEWKFKHPDATGLERAMEKASGMELGWFFEQWINTTNTIDYAFRSFAVKDGKSYAVIECKGRMMMPVEVEVKYVGGKTERLYIPLTLMRAEKTDFKQGTNYKTLTDWEWANPFYTLELPAGNVQYITIDPDSYLADVDKDNNTMYIPDDTKMIIEK